MLIIAYFVECVNAYLFYVSLYNAFPIYSLYLPYFPHLYPNL